MKRPKWKKAFNQKQKVYQRLFLDGEFRKEIVHDLLVYIDDNMARSPYFARVGGSGDMQTIRFDREQNRFEANDKHVRSVGYARR